jgi:hypothetical protein
MKSTDSNTAGWGDRLFKLRLLMNANPAVFRRAGIDFLLKFGTINNCAGLPESFGVKEKL